jgi:hypothetical protein
MTTRRLAAILAADVVGYSRAMGADEAGTLARLHAVRREVIDPAMAHTDTQCASSLIPACARLPATIRGSKAKRSSSWTRSNVPIFRMVQDMPTELTG